MRWRATLPGSPMASTPRLHDMSTPLRVSLGALIGVAVGVLLLALRPTRLFESLELRFIDARTQHYLAQRPPDKRIVLAEIQEDDVTRLKELGPMFDWPWSLDINAMAFKLMAEAGTVAVAVDVLHLDGGAFLDDLGMDVPEDERRIDGSYIRERDLANELRAAYEALGNVTLGFELTREWSEREVPSRIAAVDGRLEQGILCNCPRGMVRQGANLPVSRLALGAHNLGFVNVPDDEDGVVRRSFAAGRWAKRPVPSLALATAAIVSDGDIEFDSDGVRVGGATQRLNDDGSFLVNFRGYAGDPYPRVSPADMLGWADELDTTGEVPAAARKALEGKIVIWGLNIAGHQDLVATPISGKLHGPEFHATAIDNLLHGDGRVRASAFLNALILFGLAGALGAIEGVIRTKLLPHLVPLLAALLMILLSYGTFQQGLAIDLFTPLMALVLTWGVTSVVRVMTEGRRRRWLEGTFGRYLAPSIITALKEDPGLVTLGGRRKELTILFSDVAGFTRLSEMLEAEDTVSLLNRYLTMHSAAVMEYGGVVDKFEGDAVMAFFGDPVPTNEHAADACRAAIAVFKRLPEVEPVWREMGLEEFSIRIGVNTGTVIVGNMGSDQRFDYTCMGDAVNLASRLEGANKAFDSGILIGHQTFVEAKHAIVAKPIAGLIVVGRRVPEPVYQLVAMRGDVTEEVLKHVEAYERAHALTLEGDVAGARAALEDADRLRPGDGPTIWLGGILDRLEAGELAQPWNGVVELTGK